MYIFCYLQDDESRYTHERMTNQRHYTLVSRCFNEPLLTIRVPSSLGSGSAGRRSRSASSPYAAPAPAPAPAPHERTYGRRLAHLHLSHDLSPSEIDHFGERLSNNPNLSAAFNIIPTHEQRINFIRDVLGM